LGAMEMSAQALNVVQRLLAGDPVDQPNSGLSRREWKELMAAIDLDL